MMRSGVKDLLRRTIGGLYKELTLHFLYPLSYRIHAHKQIKSNKAVFLEVRMPDLTDNFRSIYEALEKNGGYELKVCSLREGMSSRISVIRNSLRALKDLADAGTIFINDSSYLIGCLPLRKETKVIQTWHACGAFKKFGYSIADKKFGSGTAVLDRYPLHRNFSVVTVSSPEIVWAYAEAFHMEQETDKILPLGIARTDCFYREDTIRAARSHVKKVLAQHGISDMGKKIALYAPTFRGKVANAASPDVLDYAEMKAQLGDQWILLCKHHPFVKHCPQIPENCKDFALDVTKELEIEELLMVSDACISDYSSLVFEYSLFERPMLFLAYDLEDYYDWRGFYYPYEEMAPGPIVKDTDGVIAYLQDLENRFDIDKVKAFREKFMSGCDGHATERILELLGIDHKKDSLLSD